MVTLFLPRRLILLCRAEERTFQEVTQRRKEYREAHKNEDVYRVRITAAHLSVDDIRTIIPRAQERLEVGVLIFPSPLMILTICTVFVSTNCGAPLC